MTDRIFGYTWADINRAQHKGALSTRKIDLAAPGDYGSDPIGDGTFRMVPSGDIVDWEERCRRLPLPK